MIKYTNLSENKTIAVNENKRFDLYIREVGHSHPDAGLKLRLAPRDVYVLHYLVSGCGRVNDIEIHAGDGFLLAPGDEVVFCLDEADPWEHYWIMFSGSESGRLLGEAGIEPVTHAFGCGFFEQVREEFERILSPRLADVSARFDYPLLMQGILYKLLAYHAADAAQRDACKGSGYVEAAMAYIELHYGEEIDIEDIAAAVHITSRYLYKLFMRETGRSPKQVLTDHRMKCAAYLLTTSQMPVSEIARGAGYASLGQFSAAFRKSSGMPPSLYRKHARENGENFH